MDTKALIPHLCANLNKRVFSQRKFWMLANFGYQKFCCLMIITWSQYMIVQLNSLLIDQSNFIAVRKVRLWYDSYKLQSKFNVLKSIKV